MHQSFVTTSPRGPGNSELNPLVYLRGVPVVPWICRAFDSRQNSGGNSSVFLTGIVRCFDRIFAGI